MTKQGGNHEHWSRFWENGYITTFGPTMPNNYGTAVRKFWYAQFDALDPGAVILDVATGNGAIAILAANYAEESGKDFSIMAADAAVINDDLEEASQALTNYRSSIDFYSETPCESLPFEDASVDLVCSQYGIEYSVLAESLDEVARILKTGGHFRAIMHHAESRIVSDSKKELSILTEAIVQQRVFEKLEHYFTLIGHLDSLIDLNTTQQSPITAQAASELNNSLAELMNKYPKSPIANRITTGINNIFRANVTKSEKERQLAIDSAHNYLLMSIERIRDLEAAAITPQMMDSVRDTAQELGLKQFVSGVVKATDGKIGSWQVYARKVTI